MVFKFCWNSPPSPLTVIHDEKGDTVLGTIFDRRLHWDTNGEAIAQQHILLRKVVFLGLAKISLKKFKIPYRECVLLLVDLFYSSLPVKDKSS